MTSLHQDTRSGIRASKVHCVQCFHLFVLFLSPNDTKVIKVSSAALSAKRLLEGEDHTGHTVPVPYGTKDAISKPGSERRKHF